MATPAHSSPLAGLVVVDLTSMLAGPFATMVLADLGATVIKIESPGGDFTRAQGPFTDDDELRAYGGYFQSVNRNKHSVVLDLKAPDGRARLLELVAGADAVIENFRNGVMDRFDLSYETLRELRPALVYVAVRGFGDRRLGTNPLQEWPAYDINVQALSGLMDSTGEAGGPPTKVGPGLGDTIPGLYATIALLSGLRRASETGQGAFIDVSMYDCMVSMNDRGIYHQSYTGELLTRQGNSHPLLSPFDVLPANDGWVTIAAPSELHWTRLCALIGRPDLLADARTANNISRVSNRAFVTAEISEFTITRSRAEILDVLGGHVPVAPVNSTADILADPYVHARGLLVDVEQPGSNREVTIVRSPIRFAGEEPAPVVRAPLLGEHNDTYIATQTIVHQSDNKE